MVLDVVLRLIYPPKCIFCHKLLKFSEQYICNSCQDELINWQPMERQGEFFKTCYALFPYQNNVKQAIRRFKFETLQFYAKPLAKLLAEHLQQQNMTDFDYITWAPVSKRRRRQRGYDQSQLLAVELAKQMQLPSRCLLRKTKDIPPQTTMPDSNRRKANVLGAYRIAKTSVENRRILLVDDVVTTGATLSECSRVLCTAGAKEVICATIATAVVQEKR